MHLLALGGGGFAAVGILAVLAPTAPQRWRPLVPLLAIASAVAGAAATPAATGINGLDTVLRGALGAAVVLLAAHARTWYLIPAAGLTLVAAGTAGPAAALSVVALGISVGAATARFDVPFINAMLGGLVVESAFRLEGPDGPRATAYVAAAALVIITAAGVAGLPKRPRRLVLQAASMVGRLVIVAGLLGVLSAALARPVVEDGIRSATAGLDAARHGNSAKAAAELGTASRSFTKAQARLDAWWARPALAVPGIARQSRALRTMASAGVALSHAGARAAGAVDTKELRLVNGTVPLDRLQALRGQARGAFAALVKADARLAAVQSPWLLGPVASRLTTLSSRVGKGRAEVRSAMVAFEVAPALLGADGPRHYFLAIQTPAEQRGSGGIIGNYGEIGAVAGKLTLDKVGRDGDLNRGGTPATRKLIAPPDYISRYSRFDVNLVWQNITMAPDFPTVARAIEGLYPQSGGRAIDGVISIDPLGLAALLHAIGPIEVTGWPVPITGDNAAQILLFDQYVKLDGDPRVAFLGQVTQAVWQRVSTTTASVADLVRALGPMVAEKHLMLASTHPSEERAFLDLGVAGGMAPVRGDFLGVVTQNAGGNKIDWFLRRSIDYQAKLDPATGEVLSRVRITLRNDAPATGLPPYVIGSATTPPLSTGTNKTYLSVYSPLPLSGATVDGQSRSMESELERDRHVYSTFLTIPPRGSAVVELDLKGTVDAGGGYHLGLHRQPFLAADVVTTSVEVPKGWQLGDGSYARKRTQTTELRTDRDVGWAIRRAG